MGAAAEKPLLTPDDIGGAETLDKTLRGIWGDYALRVMACLGFFLIVVALLVWSNYQGARQAIAENARVMSELHRHVEANNSLIHVLEDERKTQEERYRALLAAMETLRQSVERKKQ